MTLYATGTLLSEPANRPPALPSAVADSCRRYVSIGDAEHLVMVVDETIFGSGKNSLVITNQRVLRFVKDQVEEEIVLANVHSIRMTRAHVQISVAFNDYHGGSQTVLLQQVTNPESEAMLAELQARLKTIEALAPVSRRWQCSRCGPGEVIHLSRVHAGAKDEFIGIQTTIGEPEQFWFSAFVCRKCGRSELFLDGARNLPIDRIAVAALIGADRGPYR